jgi:hypothetical protein
MFVEPGALAEGVKDIFSPDLKGAASAASGNGWNITF